MDPQLPYKVRYKVYKPRRLLNILRPSQEFIKKWNERNGFYAKLEESILKEGIRNPIIVLALKPLPEEQYSKKFSKKYIYCAAGNEFYRFAKKSIPEKFVKSDILEICATQGGSRLFYAQKHNIKIPTLVIDFVDKYPKSPPLTTEEEIKRYFKDPPDQVLFKNTGIQLINLPHCHIK